MAAFCCFSFFFFVFLPRKGQLEGRVFRKLFYAQRGISDQREISLVYGEVNVTYSSPIKLSHVISLCSDCRGASSSSVVRYLQRLRGALLGQQRKSRLLAWAQANGTQG